MSDASKNGEKLFQLKIKDTADRISDTSYKKERQETLPKINSHELARKFNQLFLNPPMSTPSLTEDFSSVIQSETSADIPPDPAFMLSQDSSFVGINPSIPALEEKKLQGEIYVQESKAVNTNNKFGITPLAPEEQVSSLAVVVGNDPIIKGLEKYKQDEKDRTPIAIIGTSMLRSIEIALQLSNGITQPEIIIIDHSQQVIDLWDKLKEFSKETATQESFFRLLPDFLAVNRNLYHDLSKNVDPRYPVQDIVKYLQGLVENFGFQTIRRAIIAATVIPQKWQHEETFQKLKQELHNLGIVKKYLYASNIIVGVPYTVSINIMENVRLLNPTLCIHTDAVSNSLYGRGKYRPENAFLLEHADPDKTVDFLAPPKKVIMIGGSMIPVVEEKNLAGNQLASYSKMFSQLAITDASNPQENSNTSPESISSPTKVFLGSKHSKDFARNLQRGLQKKSVQAVSHSSSEKNSITKKPG